MLELHSYLNCVSLLEKYLPWHLTKFSKVQNITRNNEPCDAKCSKKLVCELLLAWSVSRNNITHLLTKCLGIKLLTNVAQNVLSNFKLIYVIELMPNLYKNVFMCGMLILGTVMVNSYTAALNLLLLLMLGWSLLSILSVALERR